MRKVVVTVDKKGKTTVAVEGVAGAGCTDILDRVTSALKANVVDEQKTAEFYEEETNSVNVGTEWK